MKKIPGFPNHAATKDGRIYSYSSHAFIEGTVNSNGYKRACLRHEDGRRRKKYFHQLVMETYVGPKPDNQMIRHLDGNKLNNNLENLKYGTSYENSQDQIAHERSTRGERHGASKLKEAQVLFIKQNPGIKNKELQKMFSISRQTINDVRWGRRWGWLNA